MAEVKLKWLVTIWVRTVQWVLLFSGELVKAFIGERERVRCPSVCTKSDAVAQMRGGKKKKR